MNDKLAKAYQKNSSKQFQNGLKLFALASPKSNEIALDVGCGTGALTYQFANAVLPKGQVIAIDPDDQRIKIAINNMPSELKNIIWKKISAEEYQSPSKPYFDVIYANYVLHWVSNISNQQILLKKLFAALRSNGRFVMQTIVGTPSFIKDITLLMGKRGEEFINSSNYTSSSQWQKMLTEVGFKIEKIEAVEDYYFTTLNEFLDWWEATTNGIFSRTLVKEQELDKFKSHFKSGLRLYGNETLRLLAYKPS